MTPAHSVLKREAPRRRKRQEVDRALAADNLQKTGYTNVLAMDGGIRVWREKGYPLTNE